MRKTPPTTSYSRGDVVLVQFVFAEGLGAKRRPAIVLSSPAYHAGRQESIVSAVTSNTDRILFGDHLIRGWKSAGLLYPSVATGIIRTIKQSAIERKLGSLSAFDLKAVQLHLKMTSLD